MNQKIIPPFEEIFSFENLFKSFKEFEKGKKNKPDVAEFKSRLVENLLSLSSDILSGNYRHGGYFHFKINDPKPRDIHKASVRDRVVHHAIYAVLYPYFDQKFIFDSYSCRLGKGTHKAIYRFEEFGKKESQNYSKTVWILKCDIRKCFASVSHDILKKFLADNIKEERLFRVVGNIINSFSQGLPLGNLTSQLFINIYLNELDLFVKHRIKAGKYIRYADDFVIFSRDKNELESLLPKIENFLKTKLDFDMHPDKVFIRTLFSGVDFLGWVHFPRHRVLRTKTKKRMWRNLSSNPSKPVVFSYLGLLKHGNAYKLREKVRNMLELQHEY
jgi:RNA-directed DNA polymerase